MLKIAKFVYFGPKYLGPQIFPRHAVWGSQLKIWSCLTYIRVGGYLIRDFDPSQKCPYSPHSGPVGCLPAPNIFPLAKETFAKEKMFWNFLCSLLNAAFSH